MNCPSCSFTNPESTRFCGGCGAELVRACSACGVASPPGFRFCGQCGGSLESPAGAPGTPAKPATSAPAERRQLTVAFCDLIGSTELAESMDAEDLRTVVRQYHAVCEREAKRFSGFIAQFLGDGVLIYFGYPRAHEDDGARAIRAALAIQTSMSRANADLVERGQPPLRVRIGIHTGPVVIGHIGRHGHHEIQATGDTMNVAARLEGIAPADSIVVSDATLRLVAGLFVTRDLGHPKLKGVSSPPRAYQIVGESGVEARLDRSGRLTPFAGRRSELEALEQAWQSAQRGEGRIVLLSGEAGMGKSRLVRELRNRDGDDAATTWLTCRCSAHYQNSALHPVIGAIERVFGIDEQMPIDARLQRVADNVKQLELAEPATALLASLLSLPVDEADLPSPPQVRRQHALHLLVELVQRHSRRAPMVLLIEDLHWADPTTLDWLTQLAPRIADVPLLLLLVSRPGSSPSWAPPAYQSSIELPRLSEADAEQILEAWSLGRDLHPEIQHAIVGRCDGVPLFLEELTRSLMDSELLDQLNREPGRTHANQQIPSTLRDALTARLDALGPTKDVIQVAALLGRHFKRSLLAAVHDFEIAELDWHLAALVDAELLVRRGVGPDYVYVFKHALVQDTAAESLLKTRRRAVHERTARALERDFPDLVESEPETLARHCEEAGMSDQACRLHQRAGARSEKRWAYVEAAGHYRRALALLSEQEPGPDRDQRELELLDELARPLNATLGYSAGELGEIYERERELLRSLGSRVDEFPVLRNIWGYHCVRGDRQATLEAADGMLAILHRTERMGVRATASWIVGATAFYTGDQTRAREHLQVAVDRHRSTLHRRSTGIGDQLFLACLVHGWSRVLAGEVELGIGLLQEGIEYAEKIEEPFCIAQALTHLSMVLYDLGRPPAEIRVVAERTLEVSKRHKLVQTKRSSQLNLGWCQAMGGDETGLELIETSIEMTRRMDMHNPIGTMLTVLADAQLQLGRVDAANATLDEAFDVFRDNICRHHEPLAHVLRARVMATRDDPGAAENSLRTAVRIASGQGGALFELVAASELVRLVCASGIVPAVVEVLSTARARHPADSTERYCVEADALLADVAELDAQLGHAR